MANTMMELVRYFKVSVTEFKQFWVTLSDEEKKYYTNASLDL